jgi:hypothetical protein
LAEKPEPGTERVTLTDASKIPNFSPLVLT